jgi:hypothetical protein
MILNLNASMAEVTRLTRAGRLGEAMALLQGSPQKPESPEGNDRKPVIIRTPLQDIQVIDMMPSRSGSGPWTVPGIDAQQHTATGLAEGVGQPRMPGAMRGILERFANPDHSRGA